MTLTQLVQQDAPSFDVRVPSSILYSPLPAWVKLVWIAIRSYQGRGESCRASYATIGERCITPEGGAMDKGQVARGVYELMDHGLLYRKNSRELVCLGVDQESTPIMKIVDQESTTVDQESTVNCEDRRPGVNGSLIRSQRIVDQESTPSENQQENQQENKRGRSAPPFPPSSWQYQFAKRFATRLRELDTVHAELNRKWNTPHFEDQMQQWADTIDKLHRIDGHSTEVITKVFKWLLTPENWWISKKAIRTATKLRDRHEDGEKYFDKLRAQMKAKEPPKKPKTRSVLDLPTPARK